MQIERNMTGSKHFPSFVLPQSESSSPTQIVLKSHSLLAIHEEEKYSNPLHYLFKKKETHNYFRAL